MQVPERPPITEYPGWFPEKQPLRKRRWVQVTATGIAAFVLGSSLGGSTAPDQPSRQLAAELPAGPSEDEVQEQVDTAVDDAVEGAVSQAVARERTRAAKLVDQAEVEGRTQLRAAVREVRAAARQSQTAAVARAVRSTTAKVRAQAAAVAPAPAPAPAAPAPAPAPAPTATDPQFSFCYEANDAGFGNYVRGQDPEYAWYDDNDGDGVVCET